MLWYKPAAIALAPTGEAVAVRSAFDEVYAAGKLPRRRFESSRLVGSGFVSVMGIAARGNAAG